MLRLPPYRYHRPDTVQEAVGLLAEFGEAAIPVSGGTDLIPNMKHKLFTPAHLVALKGIGDLKGIHEADGELVIGAAETLTGVSLHPSVRLHFTALADAAGHVAGPQLRNSGTIGGNLCLDTRCTYYNQSHFWRQALGFCLKKDGDVCHVTQVGKKCVAAHSADTPPVLMTLGASVDISGPGGDRTVAVKDFFVADGIWNTIRQPGDIVTRIRVPLAGESPELRTGYVKLRQRRSIDFPLLTVAVAADVDSENRLRSLRGVVTALGARPKELTGWNEMGEGEVLNEDLIEALADRAFKQCHPLENMIVDTAWRRAMVPVHVTRALRKLAR
jgi:4-hydroxybenzoyl-CoA reductase subunit beta